MAGFERILCPVDKSDFSARALQYAVALQQSYDAELTVLTVRPLEVAPALWTEYPVAPPLNPMDAEIEEAEPRGSIHRAVGAALAKVSDLIVLGVHGRNAIDLALFGSTTRHVLHRATVPVLTVPRDVKAAAAAA